MEIQGLAFVGTRTGARAAMSSFVRDVLGLRPVGVEGAEGDFFAMPDGTSLAVTPPDDDGSTERTVGFLVADVAAAVRELRAAGVDTDEPAETSTQRYVHFRAPDGQLYELVENLA